MTAAKNTRVAVPLTEEGYDAISTIAKISGKSRGRIMADAFEVAVPSFIAIAKAYKAAQAVEGAERDSILQAMQRAEEKLVGTLHDVNETMPNDDLGR